MENKTTEKQEAITFSIDNSLSELLPILFVELCRENMKTLGFSNWTDYIKFLLSKKQPQRKGRITQFEHLKTNSYGNRKRKVRRG
jgi:hypothetical protein